MYWWARYSDRQPGAGSSGSHALRGEKGRAARDQMEVRVCHGLHDYVEFRELVYKGYLFNHRASCRSVLLSMSRQ